MPIKVNIDILNKRRGDIVQEDDKHYDAFSVWAMRKDRKQGVVICETITEDVPQLVEKAKKKYTCDICDAEFDYPIVLANHTKKEHRREI